MKQIEVKDLNFSYDGETNILKNLSFSIEKGQYVSIIGQNGSGKSTVAKLIVGLLEKASGDIFIDSKTLSEENIQDIRDKVGIVFQNPDNQFIGATVRDDIAFGLENHNVDPSEMDSIIEHFAKEVNMSEYLNSEPTRLSGGQKQRVAIAGVLAMSPDILIFDEATSMLDPQGKAEIGALIDRIFKERKLTVISITHDIEEVSKSDYVIVLKDGQIAMEGKPSEILSREQELIDLQLDVPFAYKLAKELKKEGIIVKESLNVERLVEELCQFVSMK